MTSFGEVSFRTPTTAPNNDDDDDDDDDLLYLRIYSEKFWKRQSSL